MLQEEMDLFAGMEKYLEDQVMLSTLRFSRARKVAATPATKLTEKYIRARIQNTNYARIYRARKALLLDKCISKIERLEKAQEQLNREKSALQKTRDLLLYRVKDQGISSRSLSSSSTGLGTSLRTSSRLSRRGGRS